jgi:hypothetical protein
MIILGQFQQWDSLMAMTHGVIEDRLHIPVTEPLPREIHPYWGLLALALVFFAAIASGIGYGATRPAYGTQVTGSIGSAHELFRDEERRIAFPNDQVIVFNAEGKTTIVPYETATPLPKGTAVAVTYNRDDPYEYRIYDTGSYMRVLLMVGIMTILLGIWGSLAIVRHIRREIEAGEA